MRARIQVLRARADTQAEKHTRACRRAQLTELFEFKYVFVFNNNEDQQRVRSIYRTKKYFDYISYIFRHVTVGKLAMLPLMG